MSNEEIREIGGLYQRLASIYAKCGGKDYERPAQAPVPDSECPPSIPPTFQVFKEEAMKVLQDGDKQFDVRVGAMVHLQVKFGPLHQKIKGGGEPGWGSLWQGCQRAKCRKRLGQ